MCFPRAPSLAPLSSLSALSLPKPIYKQEFTSCLVPATCLLPLGSWQRLRLVALLTQGLQPLPLHQRLALPGRSAALGCVGCRTETFLQLTQHYLNTPGCYLNTPGGLERT